MNITSNNTMIFAKEFEGKTYYRAGLSSKKQDGSYDKAYIDVRLPKGVELKDKVKIDITKGFLTFYKNKEGKNIFYIVIQELRTEYENYVTKKQEETKEETDPFEAMKKRIEEEQQQELNLQLPF